MPIFEIDYTNLPHSQHCPSHKKKDRLKKLTEGFLALRVLSFRTLWRPTAATPSEVLLSTIKATKEIKITFIAFFIFLVELS